MRINVRTNLNMARILHKRGLGDSKDAQRFLATTVARFCDPYVPMGDGDLKNSVDISDSKIEYRGPYAHYQYIGEVMAGRAPKHYTGVPIDYHGGPMRGKEWDKRMMADRKSDVVRALDAWLAQRGR